MYLTKCPCCGKNVANTAKTCPHCGAEKEDREQQKKQNLKDSFHGFLILIFIIVLWRLFN